MVEFFFQKGKIVTPKWRSYNYKSKVVKSNLGFVKRVEAEIVEAHRHYMGSCVYCGNTLVGYSFSYVHPLTNKIEETPHPSWGECECCGGV